MKTIQKHSRAIILCLVVLGIVLIGLKVEAARKNEIVRMLSGLSYSAERWFSDAEAGNSAEYERHYGDFLKTLGSVEDTIWDNGGFGDGSTDRTARFLNYVFSVDILFCSHTLTDGYAGSPEFAFVKRYFSILNHSAAHADSFHQFVKLLDQDEDVTQWLDDYAAYKGFDL